MLRPRNPLNDAMPHARLTILLPVLLVLLFASCDRTPHGVLSENEMADLIVDLQLAEAYIENNVSQFGDDSSKMVIKQSVFHKHGITQQEYDSSLVWYAHNMENYVKAHDKAVAKLQARQAKLDKGVSKTEDILAGGPRQGEPTHNTQPAPFNKLPPRVGNGKQAEMADTLDIWKGRRCYLLTQGARRGFITFDLTPDGSKKSGDRYKLVYKLMRGGNNFKVSLNVDYSDGSTAQMARPTNSDGWVTIDVQSDTTRTVRRVYGYVSYDIKPGHVAYVDSLMLMRTRLNLSNYGYIHSQRRFERQR